MQLLIENSKGIYDVSGLLPTVNLSGDWQQVARTLEFSLVTSGTDKSVPLVDCPLGTHVRLREGKTEVFDGFVISRTGSTGGNTIDYTCYDRGFYLKRNKASYKFTNTTPEDAAAQICRDFEIPCGELVKTGIAVSRKFFATSLYDIILTMYTLAAKSTEKKYHAGFRADKFCVLVKEPDDKTLVIEGGRNLMEATTTESIAKMVNAVGLYDADENFIKTVQDDGRIKLYGMLQDQLKQTKDNDREADAKELLEENGISQKITVQCLGDITSITGGSVIVREPQTGLRGLFYINSDTHTWKKGQYFNKLVLNYKCMMDETESGSEPKKN